MPDPDDIFRDATAELFGDDAPLGDSGGSLLVSPAATTEAKGGFGSPLASTSTQRLAAERRLSDLQRRQVDAQPNCPDYP